MLMKLIAPLFLFISASLFAQDTIPPIFTSFWPTDTVVLDVKHPLSSLNQKIEATDNVDGNVTSSIKTSGSFVTNSSNRIGLYDLTYSVSDKAGNSASKSVIISVEDRFAPTIQLIRAADTLILLQIGEQFDHSGFTATDNYDSKGLYYFILEKIDSSVAGRYEVCLYAVDSSLNRSDTLYQTVCVGLDTTACLSLPRPSCAGVAVDADKPMTKNMVSIYPNPSKGKFRIEANSVIRRMEIIDGAGHQWTVLSNSRSLNIHEAGMYILRITTSVGIENHKLIVE